MAAPWGQPKTPGPKTNSGGPIPPPSTAQKGPPRVLLAAAAVGPSQPTRAIPATWPPAFDRPRLKIRQGVVRGVRRGGFAAKKLAAGPAVTSARTFKPPPRRGFLESPFAGRRRAGRSFGARRPPVPPARPKEKPPRQHGVHGATPCPRRGGASTFRHDPAALVRITRRPAQASSPPSAPAGSARARAVPRRGLPLQGPVPCRGPVVFPDRMARIPQQVFASPARGPPARGGLAGRRSRGASWSSARPGARGPTSGRVVESGFSSAAGPVERAPGQRPGQRGQGPLVDQRQPPAPGRPGRRVFRVVLEHYLRAAAGPRRQVLGRHHAETGGGDHSLRGGRRALPGAPLQPPGGARAKRFCGAEKRKADPVLLRQHRLRADWPPFVRVRASQPGQVSSGAAAGGRRGGRPIPPKPAGSSAPGLSGFQASGPSSSSAPGSGRPDPRVFSQRRESSLSEPGPRRVRRSRGRGSV